MHCFDNQHKAKVKKTFRICCKISCSLFYVYLSTYKTKVKKTLRMCYKIFCSLFYIYISTYKAKGGKNKQTNKTLRMCYKNCLEPCLMLPYQCKTKVMSQTLSGYLLHVIIFLYM